MKSFFFLAALMVPASFVPAALAAAPTKAKAPAEAQAASKALAPLEKRLADVLAALERSNNSDMYDAARLVFDETDDPTRFRELMEQAASKGSAAAITWLAPIELAELQAAGEDLVRNRRAVEIRRRVFAAADKKAYSPALVQASQLAGLGVGAAANHDLALRYLMDACKLDNRQARAGYLLVSGRIQRGGVEDPAVAAELKKKNYPLEELIARSKGDTPEAIEWLKRASEDGSSLAPYLLSQSDKAGLGNDEAMKYLELAAERHNLEAMSFLGNLKLRAKALTVTTGIPLHEDIEGGRRLLALSAALGNPEAAQAVATAEAQGLLGKVDAARVCRLFRQAADLGEAHGLAGYGYCLLTGRGCEADATKGEALLQRGIEKGAQWGNQALASAYFNGFGVKPDLRAATNALGEDALMGSVHAYSIMAAITALGNEGTPSDMHRARVFLDLAKGGDKNAQAMYDAILEAKSWRFFPALW